MDGSDALFAHPYEKPRGRESVPLMDMGLMVPVTDPPVEILSARQVLNRSLASVREPFRRSRLVVGDQAAARALVTELVRIALEAADRGIGASVQPIRLSLGGILAADEELARSADAVRTSGDDPRNRARALGSALELVLGAAAESDRGVAPMASSVAAGNAVLLVLDDTDGSEVPTSTRRALDVVFGEDALSHVAVILVTAHRANLILSDMQTFTAVRGPSVQTVSRLRHVSRGRAAWCRTTAFWGSLPLRAALPLAGVLALGLVAFVVWRYDELTGQRSAGLYMALAVYVFAPFVAGYYVWGLAPGSEEVRKSTADTVVTSMLGLLLFLLILLPRGMEDGWARAAVVAVCSLPGAALTGFALVTVTALVANVAWLRNSLRVSKGLDSDALEALRRSYEIELHIASHGRTVSVPGSAEGLPNLPLLICMRNRHVVAVALEHRPQLMPRLRTMILEGLKKDSSEVDSSDIATSSLLLAALRGAPSASAGRLLELVADDLVSAWPRRDEFGTWHERGTSFEMNSVEYAARQICYLTDLEPLVVVR